jgi:hypothetical protein
MNGKIGAVMFQNRDVRHSVSLFLLGTGLPTKAYTRYDIVTYRTYNASVENLGLRSVSLVVGLGVPPLGGVVFLVVGT